MYITLTCFHDALRENKKTYFPIFRIKYNNNNNDKKYTQEKHKGAYNDLSTFLDGQNLVKKSYP